MKIKKKRTFHDLQFHLQFHDLEKQFHLKMFVQHSAHCFAKDQCLDGQKYNSRTLFEMYWENLKINTQEHFSKDCCWLQILEIVIFAIVLHKEQQRHTLKLLCSHIYLFFQLLYDYLVSFFSYLLILNRDLKIFNCYRVTH